MHGRGLERASKAGGPAKDFWDAVDENGMEEGWPAGGKLKQIPMVLAVQGKESVYSVCSLGSQER